MSLLNGFGKYFLSLIFSNIALFHGLALFAVLIVGCIIYGHALIPLKHVPGPWLSRLFPLRDIPGREIRGKRLLNLHNNYGRSTYPLLLTLGPIIRLGPRLISVQGTEAIQTIYNTSSKWRKPVPELHTHPTQITSHGALYPTASLNDVKCRNILQPSFTSEAVAAQQNVILNCADTALTVTEIACESEEGKVDVLQIARTYAFDVIST